MNMTISKTMNTTMAMTIHSIMIEGVVQVFVTHVNMTMTISKTKTMTIPSIMIEGVVQAFVAVLGIIGNIACIVILSRFEDNVMFWGCLLNLVKVWGLCYVLVMIIETCQGLCYTLGMINEYDTAHSLWTNKVKFMFLCGRV